MMPNRAFEYVTEVKCLLPCICGLKTRGAAISITSSLFFMPNQAPARKSHFGLLNRTLLFLLSLATPVIAETWPLDRVEETLLVRGTAKPAEGASGRCLVLDGESLIELKDSAKLGSGAFTVSLWFNPYELTGAQQVLAGKNRYSRNERQWSLTIEPNGRLRAYLQQDGWSTISCDEPLKAGGWHWATLVVDPDKAILFLNGKHAGEVKLKRPIASTDAPITLGGIWDAEGSRQAFHGALDECTVIARALTGDEIAANYRPVPNTHAITAQVAPAGLSLWDATQTLPRAADLPQVAGASFHVIKKQRPDEDSCRWTLGVGLAWHKGKLYASYGFNTGEENPPTEEAHVRVSSDGGMSWARPVVMDPGEGNLGVSHGVFLSQGGNLWAFMGAFYDRFQRTHTRAYKLDETTNSWKPHGVVVPDGFWPMQEPQKMADGNWIMAGARISNGYSVKGDLPAVAISKGDDFTRWEMVVIAPAQGVGIIWGESTVLVEDKRILNISRYGKKALALVSVSEDNGRTWTPSAPSNLPMATSKPYSGILSTGQRYLVCTTTADTGESRSPLTIAVSKPGESVFSRVFLVRRSIFDGTPGVSHPKADFSYPYAVERDGNLYIAYTHKSHAANELAVIPITSLSVTGGITRTSNLESRGLPGLLFNNDSDDLKWPAYPEHHTNGLWVLVGKYLQLPTINSLDDALAPRIGPLAKTKTQGLAYCGNFGLPIWELKRDHIAALGEDPLQPILQFWKRDGRTFFFSMRMNDAHQEIFNWAHLWDDFRRTHRDLWIDPPTDAEWETQFLPWLNGTSPKPVFPSHRDLRLDYSKPQVRKLYLDTLREACRRYDLDGIELDWLRSPKLFRRGEVDTATITAFVTEVREILDVSANNRGRPLRLVSRVPDSPELARAMGLDVEAWLEKNLLDAVIAGNGVMFSDLDLEQWVTLAHRYQTPVYGSLERMKLRKSFSRYGTPETLRAAAATLWEKGADGLYFFNFYLRDEMPLLDQFGDRAKLAELPKEYFCDMDMLNGPWSSLGDLMLLTLNPSSSATVKLVIADDPATAVKTSLEMVFKADEKFEPPVITLNGQPLAALELTRGKSDITLTLSSAALTTALKRGGNVFTFTSSTGVTLTALSVHVTPLTKTGALDKRKSPIPVTQALLNSIHVTPKLNFDPMPAYSQKYLPFAMAASMESTHMGRLWTCWAGGQDGPNAYLMASFSDDQGKSWRDPVFVIDPQAHGFKMGTRLGSFWCDPKGRLWLFFHQSVGMFDGSCSNWYVRCDDPDTANPVWTDPVYIGFGASLNKPVVRKNAEWILPVSLWERWHIDKPFADCYHELDAVRGSNVFVSDDEGGHWRYRGGNIFKDSCFNEHSIVEKKDGTLWMLSRCMKEIAQSFSTDGGKTWQAQTTFFPQVNSKAVFRRLQSGNLLIIKHGASFNTPAKDNSEAWNWGKGRSYLTAFLSTDDGKTWPSSLLLDERSPVSYPDIAQTPNGDIYVHYDRDRTGAAEILFARFREEDVQAGNLVSEGAALKNLVKSKQGMNHGTSGGKAKPLDLKR